ncbi:MAG: TIR domain-containing protein [Myxococcota bacterium]
MLPPPLHVHILFDPSSNRASEVARAVAVDWLAAPTEPDLRVPVYLMPIREGDRGPPKHLRLDRAANTVVAILIDDVMADFVDGAGHAWAEWLDDRFVAQSSELAVLPCVMDARGFELVEKNHALRLEGESTQDRASELGFAIACRALHLLRGGKPEDPRRAPVSIFLSHAKKNLDKESDNDIVRLTRSVTAELPIESWFDARNITWGDDFAAKIERGIEVCDVVLIFLTDDWSSRPWCIAEGLLAKKLGTPTLVVNALEKGEVRNFPYGGNTRTLRWQGALRPDSEEEAEAWRRRSRAEGKRIVSASVREALRRQHSSMVLTRIEKPDDQLLDVAPEPARVAWTSMSGAYLYPDPPLGKHERALLERLFSSASFDTPMTRFAASKATFANREVAVSISDVDDLPRWGLGEGFVRLLTDEVHLYLLMAGLRIVYGGKLDPDKLDDPDNFTLRLFTLAQLFRRPIDEGRLEPIVNAAPWPLWKLYSKEVKEKFGRSAKLECLPLPSDFPFAEADLEPLPGGFVPPKSPLQLFAWSRSMTYMRERTTARAVARVCSGGRIEGYKGRMAGLIEEPYIQMQQKKPLFLLGAFGGCTRLVIDLLEGSMRPEMTTEVARESVPHYDEIVRLYDEHGGEIPSREEIAETLREAGAAGPAAALQNGLDDEENRFLFETESPTDAARLILKGLENLLESTGP